MIYADYAATTPVDPRVTEAMLPYLRDAYYNPSSLYPEARKVRMQIESARENIAGLLGAEMDRIIFTSGGTEADNLALLGVALHPGENRRHIITSSVEHHAVLNTCEWLETQGFTVTYLPVDKYGKVSWESLQNAMTEDTFFVSIMWVNNELGTIQDIKKLAKIAHEGGAWFHTDAVQAMTTQMVDVIETDVDLLTCSSHKIYGPKGCGVLYAKECVPMIPLMHGGQQEAFRRGGTENVPAIIGMGKAAELLLQEKEEIIVRMKRWKEYLIRELSQVDGAWINSPEDSTACSVLNVAFRNVEAEGLIFWLSRAGVQASMGSACDTMSVEPSHVIRAIGLEPSYARGCVRLSFGRNLDDEQIQMLGKILKETVAQLREE